MKSKSKRILGFAILLVGLTLCGVGVWLLLSPAQYEAIATIEVVVDHHPDPKDPDEPFPYDPYFIQTEFEKIQSQVVLGKVVDALDLNKEWGKRYNGGRVLETKETIKMLQRRIKIGIVSNTMLVEIHVTTENADESASIANAIAEAYLKQRSERLRQNKIEDFYAEEKSYQNEARIIKIEQASLEEIKKEWNLTNTELPEGVLESNYPAYFRVKRDLAYHESSQRDWTTTIKLEKSNINKPPDPLANIAHSAVPPKSPISPNRALGMVLSLCGLAISRFGISILKKS